MKGGITVVTLLILSFTAGALFIYSGYYNVAASEPHAAVTRWLLTTARDRSIDRRASEKTPPQLSESNLIQNGAQHYVSNCAVCHGAPGRELSEIARGMNPPPPQLDSGEVQRKFSDAELYWIVEHGIRMTGMPAFGSTHDEKEIWAIVAFLKRLPEMKPDQYESMSDAEDHEHGSSHRHEAG